MCVSLQKGGFFVAVVLLKCECLFALSPVFWVLEFMTSILKIRYTSLNYFKVYSMLTALFVF